MSWTLVIVVLLNHVPKTVQVDGFGEWTCGVVASGIKEKIITIDNNPLPIQSISCKLL